jgi:ATP-dependent DNA ligase
MSRLKFLTKYAVDGVHYDAGAEIDKALNGNVSERMSAIEHPKATVEHIDRVLNDDSEYVRRIAICHPKVTSEHISKALNDDSGFVRKVAICHPKVTSEHISKALNMTGEKWDGVRRIAICHPNATSEHISKALNDDSGLVRSAAELIKKERNL